MTGSDASGNRSCSRRLIVLVTIAMQGPSRTQRFLVALAEFEVLRVERRRRNRTIMTEAKK